MKKTFFLKLNTFKPFSIETMTEDEKLIMQQHQNYWLPYINDGTSIVMGPVFDTNGIYGVAIVEVATDEQLNQLIQNDPALQIAKYEVFSMLAVHK